jgi:hypothetical protein
MTTLPPAGWYTDPGNDAMIRYWDGHSWTEHSQPQTQAPPTAPPMAPPGFPTPPPAYGAPPGYAGYGYAPFAPAKKRHIWWMIVMLVAGSILLLFTVAGMFGSTYLTAGGVRIVNCGSVVNPKHYSVPPGYSGITCASTHHTLIVGLIILGVVSLALIGTSIGLLIARHKKTNRPVA